MGSRTSIGDDAIFDEAEARKSLNKSKRCNVCIRYVFCYRVPAFRCRVPTVPTNTRVESRYCNKEE